MMNYVWDFSQWEIEKYVEWMNNNNNNNDDKNNILLMLILL